MKKPCSAIATIALLLLLGVSSVAQSQTATPAGQVSAPAPKPASNVALSKDALDDIAKHERIAAAHTEAANCLRSGKPDSVCEGPLQQACKGIAIGKFCGMKH